MFRNSANFFSHALPFELVKNILGKICSHKLIVYRTVNKAWQEIIDDLLQLSFDAGLQPTSRVPFYVPLYQPISSQNKNYLVTWNAANNAILPRYFYRSITQLFDSSNASSCYKVELSLAQIKQHKTSSQIEFNPLRYYLLHPVQPQEIVVRIGRNGEEMKNGFYECSNSN